MRRKTVFPQVKNSQLKKNYNKFWQICMLQREPKLTKTPHPHKKRKTVSKVFYILWNCLQSFRMNVFVTWYWEPGDIPSQIFRWQKSQCAWKPRSPPLCRAARYLWWWCLWSWCCKIFMMMTTMFMIMYLECSSQLMSNHLVVPVG